MKRNYFYSGLFFVCLSVMMLQTIETRLLSVTSHYYLAFLSISMAMFGMTVGAVWVYYGGARFNSTTLARDTALLSSGFAFSIVASLLLQITHAPVQIASATMFVVWAELALIMATPFFFAGAIVSLALTRSPFPVNEVYGVDLVGSALGCLGVLGVLEFFDAPSAILLVAAIALLASAFFARSEALSRPATTGFLDRITRRPLWIAGVLIAVAALNASTYHGIQPVVVKNNVDTRAVVEYEKWNSFSRIFVHSPVTDTPFLWAPSSTMPKTLTVPERRLNIDGDAATSMFGFSGRTSDVSFVKFDVTNAAYAIRNRGRAAVIGVGGGRDVLSAWTFGFRDITAVELNPVFVDLLTRREPFASFAGLGKLDGVRFFVDEARSWFARTTEHFDLIQMSLIDTFAATGAGAYSLSENGLYTLAGWHHFVGALTPTGVFTVSRWYATNNVDETSRLLSLAVRALMDFGVSDPGRHLALVANDRLATLIVARSPFTADEIDKLRQNADAMKFKLLLLPGRDPASPTLRNIAASHTPGELASAIAGSPLDLTPPTDDRPFFFNQLPLTRTWRAFDLKLYVTPGVQSGNILASFTLLLILLIASVLVVVTVLVPLRPAIRDTSPRLAIAGTAYFLLIGIAFMFVEIGLLQRLSVFLGHPIYSLCIVLFSVVLFTGLGSFVSGRLPLHSHAEFAIWAIMLAAYVAALPSWLPAVLGDMESRGILARAAAAIAVIAPAGLFMGFGFPTGMRMILEHSSKPAPWFWGINGAASVLGSILAVAISITYGINWTLYLGAVFYAALIPAAFILRPNARLSPIRTGAAAG